MVPAGVTSHTFGTDRQTAVLLGKPQKALPAYGCRDPPTDRAMDRP